MSRRSVSFATLLAAAIAAGAFFAGRAVSDEPSGMPPEMAEKMKEWEKLKAPGPQHEIFKGLAGSWVGQGSWTDMGMTSKFTEEVTTEVVYDGRFLQGEAKMTTEAIPQMQIPSMSMTSTMVLGYDNAKQKYVHVMYGDWTTSMGVSEGTYDAATKTFTMTGVEVMAPGKERKYRMVQRITSPDSWVFEMYFTQPDGKESKAGEANYKRK